MCLVVYSLLVVTVCLFCPRLVTSRRVSRVLSDGFHISAGFIGPQFTRNGYFHSSHGQRDVDHVKLLLPTSQACESTLSPLNLSSPYSVESNNLDARSLPPRDYDGVKFLAGIEAHIQLAIPHKLFCHCTSTASCNIDNDQEYFDKATPASDTASAVPPLGVQPRCVELYRRLSGVLSSFRKGQSSVRTPFKGATLQDDAMTFGEYIAMYDSDAGQRCPGDSGERAVSLGMAPIHRLNDFTCPVCKGEPGALPLVSPLAILYGLSACHAFSCEASGSVSFERKVYSYDDLPKRYQLTQVTNPIGKNGRLMLSSGREIVIQRLNLEEDTARNLSVDGVESSLDYNRSGIGLIEVVTKACELTVPELVECCSVMSELAVTNGLCKGLMHEGNIRFDINLSAPSMGSKRIEIKNLNSFRRIRKAVLQCLSRGCHTTDPVSADSTSRENPVKGDPQPSYSVWKDILVDVFDGPSDSTDMSTVGTTLGWRSPRKGVEYMRAKSSRSGYMNLADTNIPTMTISDHLVSAVNSVALAEERTSVESLTKMYPEVPVDLLHVIHKRSDHITLFSRLEKKVGNPVLVAKWLVNYILPLMRSGTGRISSVIDVEQLSELLLAVDDKRVNVDTAKRIMPDFLSGGMSLDEYLRHHDLNLLSESATHEFVDRYLEATAVKVPPGGLGKPQLTKLVCDIVSSSDNRLNYSLVRDYLVEITGGAS